MNTMYEEICKKLGFDPKVDRYEYAVADYEDDREESPFEKLTLQELEYLEREVFGE